MSVGMMQDECPIGYKKTEVGVIPADWEASRLDELGRWVGGMTPSMRNQVFWQFGTVPWISSGDVKSLRLTSTSLAVSEYAIKQKTTTRIPVKSIIVVTRSGILRKYLPVAMNMTPMAINQDIKALVPKDHVLSEFLLHLIIWNGSQILARCLKSGTTVESLEFPWLKGFKVPIPPFSEQHIIAEALFDTDAFIETLEQLIGKKRQIKQGAMQQLLTGKKRLPGFENEPGSKQTEVGNIPKDWDRSELGSILKSMQLGGNYKNSERESNWPLIKMGNLGRGSINIDKLEFISFTQTPASRDRLKPGDVLFNTRNTLDLVGKVAIWRGELCRVGVGPCDPIPP